MTPLTSTIRYSNHTIRVYKIDKFWLFSAIDVARLLDYSVGKTSEMLPLLHAHEKYLAEELKEDPNFTTELSRWFLTEQGLYSVLDISSKPISKVFKTHLAYILDASGNVPVNHLNFWAGYYLREQRKASV